MKKLLNSESPPAKLLSREELERLAKEDEALRRIAVAQGRDRHGSLRSRFIAGTAAVALIGGISGVFYVIDSAKKGIEHFFSDENQKPGGPQLSGEAPHSPVVTVQPKAPKTESGPKVSADLAQRRVREAMGAAGVPVLPVKDRVGGDFFPKNPEALHAYLENARIDYRKHEKVPAALGDATVNCSTFVTLGVAQRVPEGVMRAMVDSLNAGNLAMSAVNCEAGAIAAFGENLRVPPLNSVNVG